MIHDIQHTAISTQDLDRALGFYRDLIGFEVESDFPVEGNAGADAILGLDGTKFRVVMLRLGESRIELFQFHAPNPAKSNPTRPVCDHGITHICLRVTDIRAEYERLAAAGVRFHCPPIDAGGQTATYMRDPDGNVVELLEVRSSQAS